jgi:GH15 family glucan-1,4-alpha-glucosidase
MHEGDASSRYGFIGDTRTGALVGPDGSIDWLCLPRFDDEPTFGRLVAGDDGGCFVVGPSRPERPVGRRYLPGTATLETTWDVDGARLVLTDGMVSDVVGRFWPTTTVVRRLEACGGQVHATVSFDPRAGDDRRPLAARRVRDALVYTNRSLALTVSRSDGRLLTPGRPTAVAVAPDRPLTVVMTAEHGGPAMLADPGAAWEVLCRDGERWRRWTAQVNYEGPRRAAVERSLITLRLLTYSPSGAPVAAPTTSLPEVVGGSRNWDYRYAWPRDACIGIGAFLGAGLAEEARAFLYWLLHASRLTRPRLPPLLTIDGRAVAPERELSTWPGYASSRPVRVGNGASDQHQLDTYGWVLDAMWLLEQHGHSLFTETWRIASAVADLVAERWREPDAGLWEMREEPAHYVHSKCMAWLALDRAVRLSRVHVTRGVRVARWSAAREALARDIIERGYDADRDVFVRAYGRTDLDAALLVLPVLGFESEDSGRVRGTIAAIERELGAGGPLLYRYRPGTDGLDGDEGAFLPCSFWLVQALARTGEVERAEQLFEELLDIGEPLGLFAEEADPATRLQLGNYPQAFTHATLVQAALALRDATAARARRRTRRGRAA